MNDTARPSPVDLDALAAELVPPRPAPISHTVVLKPPSLSGILSEHLTDATKPLVTASTELSNRRESLLQLVEVRRQLLVKAAREYTALVQLACVATEDEQRRLDSLATEFANLTNPSPFNPEDPLAGTAGNS